MQQRSKDKRKATSIANVWIATKDFKSSKIQQAKAKCEIKLRKQVKIVCATWAMK